MLHLVRKKAELWALCGCHGVVAHERILTCSTCGNIDTRTLRCLRRSRRDGSVIVVVETVADLWAWSGRRPSARAIMCWAARSPRSMASGRRTSISTASSPVRRKVGVREVILAVNATVDGQTTAHYITDLLAPYDIKVTAAGPWRAGGWRA